MPTPFPTPPASPPAAQWWVVWITNSTRTGREAPYAIEKAASAAAAAAIVENAGNTITGTNGPYSTQAAAQAYVNATTKKAGTVPVNATPTIKGLTGGGLGLPNPLADFLGRLSQASTWIRVAEVALGVALIIVGTAKLTGAGQLAKTAAKTAAKVGLAA